MVGFCLFSLGVYADTKTEILQDKVERMEAELSLIQRKLYQNPNVEKNVSSAPVKSANVDELYSQIDAQNQVIQELTQKVEQLEFKLTNLDSKVGRINQDVDFRLNELSTTKNSSNTSKTKDKDVYDDAYALLKKGEYDAAEQAFLKFMKDYPDSSLLGNANYWLGECYYAQGQYAEAVYKI